MSDQQIGAEAAIAANIRAGFMEVAGVGEDGEIRYRLTPAGEARVKSLLSTPDEVDGGQS